MIWIPETVRESESLAAYIKDYLLRMGVLSSEIDPHSVDALSHSLSMYLESSTDRAGFFVEDGNLLLLAAQALQSVGAHKAATRMLMLGNGFARPVAWLVTQQDAGWTLDVSRMTDATQAGLEIVFFRCLHAALDAMAEEWNRQQGAITVILQGAEEAGSALLGRDAGSRQVQAFVDEVEKLCRAQLQQLALSYQWGAAPRLLKASARASTREQRHASRQAL